MPNYFIALDGGGSKTHAVLFNQEHKELVQFIGKGTNFATDFEQAISNLQATVDGLLKAANIKKIQRSDCHLLGGFAGVNVPAVADRLRIWQHDFKQFDFTTDLHLSVYAASDSQYGSAIITGTGSCALAITPETEIMLGGHGLLLGDQASGAWIGKRLVEHSLLALDGFEPMSNIVNQVMQASQCHSATQLCQYWLKAAPAEYAKLTPYFFESIAYSDPISLKILDQAIAYLSQLISRLSDLSSNPIYLMGGIASKLAKHLPSESQNQVIVNNIAPVYGAFQLLKTKPTQINNKSLTSDVF